MSRVDVIVPCYRYAHFLEACVQSVLSQPIETRVLILDDASPDDTPAVAARLRACDSRVEYRRHAANKGHLATFNEGLEWARGDYTLLISADDMLVPGALERATRLLDSRPEVGMVYGRVIRIESGQSLPAPSATGGVCGSEVCPGAQWLERYCADPTDGITSPEVVVRTRLQQELGGYRADLPHTGDQEMWMRFAAHAAIGVLDADQAYYRLHNQNMHVQKYSAGPTELRHMKAAFDACFSTHGRRISDWPRLARLADVALARMALWKAHYAFSHNDLDDCRELIALAPVFWPGVRRTMLYARVRGMLSLGPRRWATLRRIARAGKNRPALTSPPAPLLAKERGESITHSQPVCEESIP